MRFFNQHYRLIGLVMGAVLLLGLARGLEPGEVPVFSAIPIPSTTWGEATLIDQAQQSRAPVLLAPGTERLFATWVDGDASGLFQSTRIWLDGTMFGGNARLALYARSQMLLPAAGDLLHLLWLDADPDAGFDATRLWSVTLQSDLQDKQGVVRLSDRRTARYSAVTADDNAVWVVWSGGLQSEPSLYSQFLDRYGRAQLFSEKIISAADFPALLRLDGVLHLFWISVPEARVHRAQVQNGQPQAISALMPSIPLQPGDRLLTFNVAVDSSHLYLLWNIARADGDVQTWMSSSPQDTNDWSSPVQLRIGISDAPFETGFNGGAGQQAAFIEQGAPLSWAAPMPGKFDVLAVAAQVGVNSLAIVYFRQGEVVGYQPLVILEEPGLIGLPSLVTDRNLHLYLSWSQPTKNNVANLYLTTTH